MRIARWTLVIMLALATACGKGKTKGGDDEHSGEGHDEHGEEKGHEEHGEDVIELTPEQLATAKIATAKVEKREESGLLRATAQIEAAGDRQARVGSRIAGRVTTLKAGVGDRVKKGQVVAVVDSPDLGRAKADYLAALAMSNVADDTLIREKALYDKRISSEKDWREAEAAAIKARAEKEAAEGRLHALGVSDAELPKRAEGHYTSTIAIRSPIDGVVVERPVTLGEMIEPSTTLFTIVDPAEVWIQVDVYERDIAQVQMGQAVTVTVGAYKGREFKGVIDNIGAVVEVKTRAVRVRVRLANEDGALKPGMFASVTIAETTGEKREGLFIPSSAVQRDGDRILVFVPKDEHEFEPREVELGHPAGDWIEIEKGLSEGELVVTSGAFILKSQLKKGELGGGHSH